MKSRICTVLIAIILTAMVSACSGGNNTGSSLDVKAHQKGKVIFDTDIAYVNDDAIAMYMLTQLDGAGELELLGVTTVGGNVFVASATTAALRQLEMIGRPDIPVYQGTDIPLAGFRDMEEESKIYGVPLYCGAYWDFVTDSFADMEKRPVDYKDLGEEPMFGYAAREAESQTAWDFMIEQVHAYPGEVTIMAVGAATNVAKAISKDPDFAKDAAGIIYMGGDIDVPGNTTPAAEMNWFYDPDAIRICLAADWKSQIVVPDDLARQVRIKKEIYDRIGKRKKTPVTDLILSEERTFEGEGSDYVWDVVVPVIFCRPEIISDMQTRYLTVDTSSVLNSGRAVSWKENGHISFSTKEGLPEGVNPVQIIFGIDEKAFWDEYVDILTW